MEKIQQAVDLAIKDKNEFALRVNKQANKETEKSIKTKTGELAKSERRISELDNIIKRIYEDHVAGKLNDDRFQKLLGDYEAEQATLNTAVEALRAELDDLKSKTANIKGFMSLAEQHSGVMEITELTAEIARSFIEKILVHEGEFENANRRSKRTQEVHVFLANIGEFDGMVISEGYARL